MIDEITSPESLDADSGPPRSPSAAMFVAAGGSVGTSLRYLLSETIPHIDGLPAGIFVVNLTGAALLGFLIEVLASGGADVGRRRTARLALGTGVLGGFTTYSALATDTADLITDGRPQVGIACVLAAIAGITITHP